MTIPHLANDYALRPLSKESEELIKKGQRYYLPNYKPREMIIERGKGARIWDKDGNEFIDLGSGIAVCSLGHADDDLVQALTEQAKKIWHTSNIFFTEPPIQLAEKLVKLSGFANRVYFCNSGAEANEAAIKLVRKFAADKGKKPEEREIITFKGSFHGRTLATVTATAQPKYQEGYEPLPGGFTYLPYNDFDALEKAVSEKTCAIMLEVIQGEGGIMPAAKGFLSHVRKLADKVGALVVIDEIQTGMYRTGKPFAYMLEEGFKPDVITIAKALGCGVPVGAMLVAEKAEQTMQFGSHGSTFGGNPIMTHVALTAMEKLGSPAITANVQRQREVFISRLKAIGDATGMFEEIRGHGLMLGAALKPQWHGKANDIAEKCRQHGVLILVAGPNVLRFLPPLNISDEETAIGLERVEAGISAYLAS